jgi:hypothetical protein
MAALGTPTPPPNTFMFRGNARIGNLRINVVTFGAFHKILKNIQKQHGLHLFQ